MSVFLALMVAGLTGLLIMAIPALGRHGHIGTSHGITPGHGGLHIGPAHTAGHIGAAQAGGHAGGALPATNGGVAAAGSALTAAGEAVPALSVLPGSGLSRFLPSPRMVFSLLALYGAFGNALHSGLHWSMGLSALVAALPAGLLEKFAVTPLWNVMLSAQGEPCLPLESLTFCEAEAVTPFPNGRGIVAVEREGRMVQFSATLPEDQAHIAVRVGDKMRIEEVDAARERMVVTLM